MSGTRETAEPGRSRSWLPFAIAAALVVVGLVVVVLIEVLGPHSATQQVELRFDGRPPAAGWTTAGAGVLVSDPDHRTRLAVQITRNTAGAAVPALTADFDGSGGGDAVVVTCATSASATWTVDAGETQEFDLPCDRFVADQQLRSIESVHIGPR